MSWIETISYDDADGRLRQLYDRVKGPDNNVDNIMMLHSLRPHTMEAHMTIYKYVLHHSNNTVPTWFLEALGIYVSSLNHCDYCVEHHFHGMKRLLNDELRSQSIWQAIESGNLEAAFDKREQAAMAYAKTLTLEPMTVDAKAIKTLQTSGFSDGEILEINQVCSYFCYANRTVLGLGASTEGDILGLSPNNSDNVSDWSHK